MRLLTLPTVLLACILTILAGCATTDEQDSSKGLTEQEIYERAQKKLDHKNWLAAVTQLQLIEEHFPFGTYGEQSQLELIYALYQSQEHSEAIVNADRFIRLHPQHRSIDYAYYMRGLASFYEESRFTESLFGADNSGRDPGATQDSFNHFSQFIHKFPRSPYAPDAQKRMIYLRNILARTEIHTANYYFKRGAYIAAANRGNFVVQNYQGTPAVPDALAVMAQAYYLLDMQPLADSATQVLAENYPDYPALNKDGTFNTDYYKRPKHRKLFSYLTLGIFERNELHGFDTRSTYNSLHFEDAPKPEAIPAE